MANQNGRVDMGKIGEKSPLDPIFIKQFMERFPAKPEPFPSTVTLHPRRMGKSMLGVDWGNGAEGARITFSKDAQTMTSVDPSLPPPQGST